MGDGLATLKNPMECWALTELLYENFRDEGSATIEVYSTGLGVVHWRWDVLGAPQEQMQRMLTLAADNGWYVMITARDMDLDLAFHQQASP